MNRRSFLHLLGLGTGVTLSSFIPLIGSGTESLPETFSSLFSGHLVYTRERRTPRQKLLFPSVITEEKRFLLHGDAFLQLREDSADRREPNQVFRRIFLREGKDPHYAVYEAALSLREGIAQRAHRILEAMGDRTKWYPELKLVTLAWSPIQVLPGSLEKDFFYDSLFPLEGDPPCIFSGEGLHLLAEFDQFAVNGPVLPGPGMELYSSSGKFPLNPPSDLELSILLNIDKQIQDSYRVADQIKKLRDIRSKRAFLV